MTSHVKIKQWLKPALFSLALAGSVSLSQAQTANDYIVNQFDDGVGGNLWAANYGTAPITIEYDPVENRGPGANPGSMKVTINFNICATDPISIQRDFERVLADTLDLTKYTKLHFSVKVDPSSSRLSDWGAGAFGNIRPHIRLESWGGDSNVGTPGEQWVGTDAYGAWVDYAKDIDQTAGNLATRQATRILGIDIWSGWGTCAAPIGHTNTVIFWLDNIWFEFNTNTAPVPPPVLAPLQKAGPSGVEITMNDNGSQYQRDAIATPSASGNYFWSGFGGTPVTYSFTVADFPDPVAHEGFEAHLYIVNQDTSGGNETYGGADWNVPDIAIVSLSGVTNDGGSYTFQFQFKTNRPNNNPLDDAIHRPGMLTSSNVLGTWSVSFTHNTNVTLSGPGGISTNFSIPEEAVLNNFSPATSFMQFGFFKNDNEGDGHNNGNSGTFSRVQKTGGDVVFDDTFNGPTLTNNYQWRKTSDTAVNHVPVGTAWKLSWSLPADGFNPQVAPAVTGPWTSAGATSIYLGGGKATALIPTSSLPPGNAAFFRLIKRPFVGLQVLLPGETAAPDTASGKTGTPDPQVAGVPFNVTVNAVDAVWNRVNTTDIINITSSDASATLPADASLAVGTRTFSVTLNTSGSWTVTATDVTDGTKTPGTSTSLVIP